MNNIGSKIRKIRDERGITKDYMAIELDMNQSNYGRLEKDDNRLTVPKLIKIGEILEISISVLFGEKHNNYINENNVDVLQNGSLIQN